MFGAKDSLNYYEILEVTIEAAPTEIHKAYQRARATYSNDNPALYSMFSKDEARDLLRMIDEAYAVLSNSQTRRSYDESLRVLGKAASAQAGQSTKANPAGIDSPMKSEQEEHGALPDFMVPDPSIPGSVEMAPRQSFAPPPAHVQVVATPQPIPITQQAQSAQVKPPLDRIGSQETIIVTNSEFTVRKRDVPTSVAPGFAKCNLSTYQVDASMEQEIASRDEFDGPFLKKVRTYKSVPLEKLSEASRIGKTYLIALESNDFKNLPAPVFLRGFLVQIARQLGLDENKVVTSYMKLAKR